MRFLLTGELKSESRIRLILWFFIIFVILHWISSILFFIINYRESLIAEQLSFASVIEEIHMNIFFNSMLLLCLLSIVIHSKIRNTFKPYIIIGSFLSLLLDCLSSLILLGYGESFLFIKILSFFLYKGILMINIIICILYLLNDFKEENNRSKGLFEKMIISFAIFNIFFVLSNILSHMKLGFAADEISEYYLGNKERFIRAKTFSGILKIFNFHAVASSIYLMALSHFLLLTEYTYSGLIIMAIFSSALVNFISPFFIRYVSAAFSYLKLFSFYIMQLCMLISSMVLFIESFKWERSGWEENQADLRKDVQKYC